MTLRKDQERKELKCGNSETSTTHYHTLKGKVGIKNVPQCSQRNPAPGRDCSRLGEQKGLLLQAGLSYLVFPGTR